MVMKKDKIVGEDRIKNKFVFREMILMITN